MKFLFQFARLAAFCLAGELLYTLLPLPVPASIYGLALLLAALVTGLVRLEQVRETALFLTGIFPVREISGQNGRTDPMELAGLDIAEISAYYPPPGAAFCEKSTCFFGDDQPENEKSGGICPKKRVNAAAKCL